MPNLIFRQAQLTNYAPQSAGPSGIQEAALQVGDLMGKGLEFGVQMAAERANEDATTAFLEKNQARITYMNELNYGNEETGTPAADPETRNELLDAWEDDYNQRFIEPNLNKFAVKQFNQYDRTQRIRESNYMDNQAARDIIKKNQQLSVEVTSEWVKSVGALEGLDALENGEMPDFVLNSMRAMGVDEYTIKNGVEKELYKKLVDELYTASDPDEFNKLVTPELESKLKGFYGPKVAEGLIMEARTATNQEYIERVNRPMAQVGLVIKEFINENYDTSMTLADIEAAASERYEKGSPAWNAFVSAIADRMGLGRPGAKKISMKDDKATDAFIKSKISDINSLKEKKEGEMPFIKLDGKNKEDFLSHITDVVTAITVGERSGNLTEETAQEHMMELMLAVESLKGLEDDKDFAFVRELANRSRGYRRQGEIQIRGYRAPQLPGINTSLERPQFGAIDFNKIDPSLGMKMSTEVMRRGLHMYANGEDKDMESVDAFNRTMYLLEKEIAVQELIDNPQYNVSNREQAETLLHALVKTQNEERMAENELQKKPDYTGQGLRKAHLESQIKEVREEAEGLPKFDFSSPIKNHLEYGSIADYIDIATDWFIRGDEKSAERVMQKIYELENSENEKENVTMSMSEILGIEKAQSESLVEQIIEATHNIRKNF